MLPLIHYILLLTSVPVVVGFAQLQSKTVSLASPRGGSQSLPRMATTTSEEIIPREILFGNPKYASPSLSPDGKYLSFLAPSADKESVSFLLL